ncbi:MAG TPA: hypothetical protein VEL76_26340, partial [Gemmataceae bacterium]|nr:hypothetical protein [Gemmataceae bacterium]
RLLVKWLAGTLHEKQDAARDVEDELLLQKWLDGSLQPDGRKDRTLLLVSHTIPMTVRFAHGRCLVIRNGKLVRGPDRPLHDETEATHEMGGTDDLGVSAGVRVP